MINQKCKYCGEKLEGRIDKVFCTPNCKSSYHYEINRDREDNLFKKIDDQIKLNRRILKNFNKAGKSTVRKEVLLEEGFDEKYITHWWKNKKGEAYRFCFEYGYLPREENGKEKYVLIQWQDYMK